jgi:glutathione S-transferase
MALAYYYTPLGSSTRVTWALEEVGVPYDKHRLNLREKEQRSPAFLAINPNGKVPTLVDDGVTLFESQAILLWLGEKYGEGKGLWPAAGTADRADAYVWTSWATVELLPNVREYLIHGTDVPFARPPEKRVKDLADSARALFDVHTAVLDGRLAGREYLLGSAFSLADCATAMAVVMAANMAQLPAPAGVTAWAARCQARPAFARTMAMAFGG